MESVLGAGSGDGSSLFPHARTRRAEEKCFVWSVAAMEGTLCSKSKFRGVCSKPSTADEGWHSDHPTSSASCSLPRSLSSLPALPSHPSGWAGSSGPWNKCQGRCKAQCSGLLQYELMMMMWGRSLRHSPCSPGQGWGQLLQEKPRTSIPQHRGCKNLLSPKCEESKSHFHWSEKSFAA